MQLKPKYEIKWEEVADLPIIAVSGPHGSGKSTAAMKVAESLGYEYISAGELFREMAKNANMNIEEFSMNDAVKSANTDIMCNLGEKFNFGMGHCYENSPGGSASLFTIETRYKIDDNWAIRAYERFDTYARTWEEQEYTIYKDLHCWLAEFTVNINDGFAFWVVFRLKAFPDVPIGLKRTYRRPTPGSNM